MGNEANYFFDNSIVNSLIMILVLILGLIFKSFKNWQKKKKERERILKNDEEYFRQVYQETRKLQIPYDALIMASALRREENRRYKLQEKLKYYSKINSIGINEIEKNTNNFFYLFLYLVALMCFALFFSYYGYNHMSSEDRQFGKRNKVTEFSIKK